MKWAQIIKAIVKYSDLVYYMIMELVSLKELSTNTKIHLLNELGYDSDGEFVIDAKGKKVIDKYLDVPVRISNMVILPGSEVILDDNELSISSYIEEYGNVL